jgi:hypothetical protein
MNFFSKVLFHKVTCRVHSAKLGKTQNKAIITSLDSDFGALIRVQQYDFYFILSSTEFLPESDKKCRVRSAP